MNRRISLALAGVSLAAFGIFATAPQHNSKVDPMEAARQNNLGAAYMNQQLFEKGLKSFQQAAELDPRLSVARLNEGIALLNLQKIDEARVALEEAARQDPKNPSAWYNLGLLAKNTGDAQVAIDDFKRVTEIDPNDADTWYFLGASYVQARQFPLAIDAFQHALKINPLHASAEFGLSRANQQSGDVDQARENLKKFQHITQSKLGAPISLAYGEQGQYSRAVESPQAVLKPPPQIKVTFVDVTKEAGLSSLARPEDAAQEEAAFLGPGACFLDFDGDGKIDILVADNGTRGGISLYHNLGSKFEEVTASAGFDPAVRAIGCSAGDYDNDGFVDLAISLYGDRVDLFHNEKKGSFKNLADAAVLNRTSEKRSNGFNAGLTFLDYDHDGDLDLYVSKYSGGYFLHDLLKPDTPLPQIKQATDGSENRMWRNNGNSTFTDVTEQLNVTSSEPSFSAIGTDYNNDRAVDLVVTGGSTPALFTNPREGKFLRQDWPAKAATQTMGIAVFDFDHDGWMDMAVTQLDPPGLVLWHNNHGKSFEQVKLPETNWARAFGVAAFDYDNDGWVDLVTVGETKEGRGEIRLFRNLGPDGFKDVTTEVGLDKIHLEHPRAIITGDYDNDGAVDLLITQNHGPAVLLRNEGGNQNHWLRLALKGLADNKSAIGTKVEVFSGGNRQKFEIYGSNGYLGQNSLYLTVGLGTAKTADVVRMLWPTGVLQDEINIEADKQQNITEIDRRGSSCPTLFAWNGKRYQFVADVLGAGVVGHWVGPGQRDIPRPVEWIKIDHDMIQEQSQDSHPVATRNVATKMAQSQPTINDRKPTANDQRPTPNDRQPTTTLSFRFMEPLEEAVYLDQVRLLAVDHPKDFDVFPNEYFASNPPYPEFKVVVSREAKPPATAWDEHGHNLLPDLLAHHYFGDFALTQFQGFAKTHSLTLDLDEPYRGGPLWLLMHGEVEYFSANSMYAASQAGVQAIAPYVEAWVGKENEANGKWQRVIDDMGFPAGGPRTMTADLSGKLPKGTRRIRITTNLQIYWDSILIDRTRQPVDREIPRSTHENSLRNDADLKVEPIPLVRADLEFHGYPFKIEGAPPGNVNYIYEKVSATGPYTRPMGTYTRYGDVLPLLNERDDKLAVFGSGDEVQLDFDPSTLPKVPEGWIRDYFFAAYGYEKDMDFYAGEGNFVAPLPFLSMREYPYSPIESYPLDDAHVDYLLEYNTRHMSGNEQRGYSFDYPEK